MNLVTRSGHVRLRAGEFVPAAALRAEGVLALQSGITAVPRLSYIGLRTVPGWSGWRHDGFFYYEGAGTGSGLNNAIVRGAEQDKPIHLFQDSGGVTRYVDEFLLDDVLPPGSPTWPSQQQGPLFRLAPVSTVAHVPGQLVARCDEAKVCFRPIERAELLNIDELPLDAVRPENELVLRFCRYLLASGHRTHRLQIRHTADHSPLFTDIWVDDAFLLVEAKSMPDRDAVRNAIGQLADYTRFLPNPQRAILLPRRPERDVIELAHSERAAVIWALPHGRWGASVAWLGSLGIEWVY
jgi:hypothetical protein